MSRVSLIALLCFMTGCGTAVNLVAAQKRGANTGGSQTVTITTDPPGADLYVVGTTDHSGRYDDGYPTQWDPRFVATSPGEVELHYAATSWWEKSDFMKYWAIGTGIDAAVAGFMGIRYANGQGRNDLIGLSIAGGFVLADIIGVLFHGPKPWPETVTLMAQAPGYANTEFKVRVPDDDEAHVALRPGEPTYAAIKLRQMPVVPKPLGKIVVLDFKTPSDTGDLARIATDATLTLLQQYSLDDVLGVKEIQSMLEYEKLKDALSCNDTACFSELGGALGADKILTGEVLKSKETITINLRLVDSKGVRIIGRTRHERPLRGGVDMATSNAVTEAVWQLLQQNTQ